MHDVLVIGGGISGLAVAARLQAQGLDTIVLESHSQAGGCAGYYRRNGFSFDVGATTLVDFEPGGVGGELLEAIGMRLEGDALPGYVACLPDATVTLYRDARQWNEERLEKLGSTRAHRRFWALLDRLARVFWGAAHSGVKLPIRRLSDLLRAATAIRPIDWPLARHLDSTLCALLRRFGLRGDDRLAGLLGMLVEDTVHNTIDEAPLINSALGVTIRGAGLTQPRGGMESFIRAFVARYEALGGDLRLGWRVDRIDRARGRAGPFRVASRRGELRATQVVCAVPAPLTAALAPDLVGDRLRPFVDRDVGAQGSALLICIGVPEDEIEGPAFRHHQLLHDYRSPLGDGNNMFISVSAPGDLECAPRGCRAVMISTHCGLAEWEGLSRTAYDEKKRALGERLVRLARRVYPRLGNRAVVQEVATPRTYERFTRRPRGAVGGVRLSLRNANQRAIPHDLGPPGFWLTGDTTWPGLGTVACVLSSRIVARDALRFASGFGGARVHLPTLQEAPT